MDATNHRSGAHFSSYLTHPVQLEFLTDELLNDVI
jgi:hypothetical protein